MMEFTCGYASPLGGITLASDGKALTGLWFEGQKLFGAGLSGEHEERLLPVFGNACRWLDVYFSGQAPDFTVALNLRGSDFARAVWAELMRIPYGGTASYGEIARRVAEKTGRARASARAVGMAVGRNPVSLIVPCHRVVGADGSLTGYAGGLWRKERLLKMELGEKR